VAGEEPSIGPATAADVPDIVALIGRVYAEYGFVYDPRVEVPDLFEFDAHYTPPRGAFFVARRRSERDPGAGDVIVGSVGVERLDPAAAELHRLYLDVAFRGRGLGRALTEHALAWCRARAITHVVLWSDTRFEDAHRLYIRMGFTRTGERTLVGDLNDTREYRFERAD
jgi:putative acetyltransferase